MENRIKRLLSKTTSVLLTAILLVSSSTVSVNALEYTSDDPLIVVSLGDSYSSGEGIEPFYDQDKNVSERVADYAWLAHRSRESWPALLEIPNIGGTMKDYNADEDYTDGSNPYPLMYNCKWYFRAASGAKTENFKKYKQGKDYKKISGYNSWGFPEYLEGHKDLPKQNDVFNEIEGTVDYVTLTIGGNDVEFEKVIYLCARRSTYLGSKKLEKKLEEIWKKFEKPGGEDIRTDIKNVYKDICLKAPEADVIVAGYPQLLQPDGKGVAISKKEARLVNSNVSKFNDKIEDIVTECQNEGKKIHFVDVEDEFNKDGGHLAYSNNAWINKIKLGHENQELDDTAKYSAYSMHPNEKGAKAYARCVNAKLAEIENEKSNVGYIKGKICKASDRSTPINGAFVTVYKDNRVVGTATADENGDYRVTVPTGVVRVEINAPGYLTFSSYTTVIYGSVTYMETFLLVEGSEDETGTAEGIITNALSGIGVEDVSLEVRNGWNNDDQGEILATSVTGSNGNYSFTLPLGNYTIRAEKEGYITGRVNIVVQSGTTGSQNGTITPTLLGDNYRIVLTWGANPSDLDSHVTGNLSSGDTFHVYYSHKSQYDGSEEVCNLDVDDTTSYGPETITLNTSTYNSPYYYYIYHYAGSGTLAQSEAKINVYQGDTVVATFNVPTDQGSGRYWNVFAIADGQLIVCNTVTSSVDVSYANSSEGLVGSSDFENEIMDTEPKEDVIIPIDESLSVDEEIGEVITEAPDLIEDFNMLSES